MKRNFPAPSSILILTSGQLCRNPRVLKEARALSAAGHDVTVLTVASIPRFEAFDRELLQGASFKKIVLDQVARDPLTRMRALANRTGTRMARFAVQFGFNSPQAFGPFYSLRQLAARFPAALTIVHTEIALCIGRDLLARGRRVAADFEDWHSQDLLPETRASRPQKLLRAVERELLHRCCYTSTPSHAMSAALHATHGGAEPKVVRNTFPLEAPPPSLPRNTPPAFFWFSQTIGPGRGLEEFITAWRLTVRPSRLCLLGDVRADYRTKLLDLLPETRVQAVEFLPIASPAALPAIIARHDIGLALEPMTPANKNLTISNKIFQYLNAGLAVLATDTAGQREVMETAPACGLLVDLSDPHRLARELDTLIGNSDQLTRMGAAARRAAETTFCWEQEAPRLVAAVEAALQSPVTSL